jgi:hypothetical protein
MHLLSSTMRWLCVSDMTIRASYLSAVPSTLLHNTIVFLLGTCARACFHDFLCKMLGSSGVVSTRIFISRSALVQQ